MNDKIPTRRGLRFSMECLRNRNDAEINRAKRLLQKRRSESAIMRFALQDRAMRRNIRCIKINFNAQIAPYMKHKAQ